MRSTGSAWGTRPNRRNATPHRVNRPRVVASATPAVPAAKASTGSASAGRSRASSARPAKASQDGVRSPAASTGRHNIQAASARPAASRDAAAACDGSSPNSGPSSGVWSYGCVAFMG
ncbi:hypothetical protein [Nitrospirillum sp. BR 11828]|uniref:hypothetical protein n=1 Tax=Nitrospirillum sp. BR 11828 TaxID=3104325 RepID=UPI003A10204E